MLSSLKFETPRSRQFDVNTIVIKKQPWGTRDNRRFHELRIPGCNPVIKSMLEHIVDFSDAVRLLVPLAETRFVT